MIIKNRLGRDRQYNFLLWILIPIVIIGGLTIYFTGIFKGKDTESPESLIIFQNDMETEEGGFFIQDSFRFEGGAYQNDTFARSGTHSIALNQNNIYGLTTVFYPLETEATYHLSVWRYNPDSIDSWLVVSAPDPKDLYVAIKKAKEQDEKGWEQMHAVFQVPPGVDSLKLYCYAGGDGPSVYFDDFVLQINDLTDIIRSYDIPHINLTIAEEGIRKLEQKRSRAWENGLLVSSEDDWVKAKIREGESEIKAKLRLKGDWLDHLRGSKWSFRVEVKDPYAFQGMKTFNLQKPETRGFLYEWIYHEMLRDQGILSPRYDFVLLSVNDEVLGIYALEEHFEKELIESSAKREGPILKFNEERFWAGVQRQFDSLGKGTFLLPEDKENAYWAAPVQAFNEKQIAANPNLVRQYERGSQLLRAYKYRQDSVHQLFDIELLGKYLAIIELTKAYHNLTWHNQRWYYNPLSDRLEPIGFDGYTDQPPVLHAGSALLSDEVYDQKVDAYEPWTGFFWNDAITRSYVRFLDSLSSVAYLDKFYSTRKAKMEAFISALEEEYPGFNFDDRYFFQKAEAVRLVMPAYEQHALLASSDGENHLFLANKHHLPLEVWTSPQDTSNKGTVLFPGKQRRNVQKIKISSVPDQIYYAVWGLNEKYSTATTLLPEQSGNSHLQQARQFTVQHNLCQIEGDLWVIRSGQCKEPIVVPPGKELVIPAGTNVDFIQGSYLLSESSISALGTETAPINIISSDGTGAIAIRNTSATSKLRHVYFDRLGTIQDKGFVLTGGVTFYEADTDIRNCQFTNSQQEDALNLVRSEFHLEQCRFHGIAFDAFDADFCDGMVKDCLFEHTGNDAMDFSGSLVTVASAWMKHIGDKGISVGEDSDVRVLWVSIDTAPIGVAAKDFSTLFIEYIDLVNVNTGFTAYQKKATFGPAEIIVQDYQAQQVDHLHIIESGSRLQLPGQEITMK